MQLVREKKREKKEKEKEKEGEGERLSQKSMKMNDREEQK